MFQLTPMTHMNNEAQGIDDALIQPYSRHESRQSLEIYSRLSLAEAQPVHEQTIGCFPIQ